MEDHARCSLVRGVARCSFLATPTHVGFEGFVMTDVTKLEAPFDLARELVVERAHNVLTPQVPIGERTPR